MRLQRSGGGAGGGGEEARFTRARRLGRKRELTQQLQSLVVPTTDVTGAPQTGPLSLCGGHVEAYLSAGDVEIKCRAKTEDVGVCWTKVEWCLCWKYHRTLMDFQIRLVVRKRAG